MCAVGVPGEIVILQKLHRKISYVFKIHRNNNIEGILPESNVVLSCIDPSTESTAFCLVEASDMTDWDPVSLLYRRRWISGKDTDCCIILFCSTRGDFLVGKMDSDSVTSNFDCSSSTRCLSIRSSRTFCFAVRGDGTGTVSGRSCTENIDIIAYRYYSM